LGKAGLTANKGETEMLTSGDMISVVDDDESVRKATKRLMNSVGLEVEDFACAEDFLASDRSRDSACLILDLRLPGMSGLELQTRLADENSTVPIIFISGHGDGQARARALHAGAIDFLQKPFSEQALFNAINPFVGKPISAPEPASGAVRLPEHERRAEVDTTESRREPKFGFAEIVGRSDVMQEMLRLARKVAESQVSCVLLQGQSGTGKDLVAKSIHYVSKRAPHPFIAINCAALPHHLIESELFGHEKGAFTDAKARKEGLLEKGANGTILLDEISELGIDLQAKLLRVLEEGSFRRVGGLQDVPFNARVIAASNRDLKSETDAGRFRLDLYYRLAVIQIDLPPLSERGDDVLQLAEHFLRQIGAANIKGFSPDVSRAFRLYSWPGNVRELRNVIERATVLEDGDLISTRSLAQHIVVDKGNSAVGHERFSLIDSDAVINLPDGGISLSEVETSLLRQAFARADGNQTRAADLLGLTRDQFRYRLKKLRRSDSGLKM
jgi:two-component system, NtrC family, response regulator AtoC